ncbi:cell wall metabolism sensor histidine kinase WalK [Paenibacillus thiaminolyticus]|uniref:histidine kinase n=1 Tax=Paenibacillus thiaminolyticus TaxID=49283 RepID=A0A3A3H304_PANTH|nr:HAMP domain-containing sensor histidine kinase [Paenibacillus thiaminolyticus]RJG23506.1 sensor histidine kinase [Paenibacillus thiaminolyticus]
MIRKISIKFLIGFFLIFSLSFIVLNQTVKEFIRTSNQKLVTSELVGVKNNSNVYVRQAFLINHFTSNELYFGEMALEMANDLKHATGSNVSVYTVDGELLYSSDKSMFPYQKDSDLKQAIKGRTAYSITYDHNTASVLFSYPVVIDGSKVGILRFSKDFSLIYAQSGRILDIIFFITLAIFAAAFLFSYILSRHITIPLVKLTWASTEVKDGNLDVRIRFNRKDEIGRLADNFNDMIDQISRQITIIKKDRDYLKELHQQEKRFFDNITHELKTPLTSILGYAELIRENGEKDPHFFEKGMNHIIEESRRLHTMVLKLLEVSRNNSMISESDKINAGIILQDVCDSMAIRAQRYKKSIKYQIEDDLVVFGQGDRLRQLFINLLDNAIKYSLSLSEISVKALHVDGKVRFVFDNPSDPIEADQLANLFHPFYLAHPSVSEEGSVGLGLSIVKSIVHDFGGTISFDSQNRHVTVTVEFDGFNSKRTENRS